MQSKQEFHIPIITDGIIAVDALAEASGLSKQKIKQCMQKGCVWLEKSTEHTSAESDVKTPNNQSYIQRLRRAKKALTANDILHFYYDESVLMSETANAVLIEDLGDYSIWNKPSGMLSQGSKWGDHTTLYRWAEKHLQPERPAFVVHRLDRAANGLSILAHKKNVASLFSRMFETRQIDKQYEVMVEGDFSAKLQGQNTFTLDDTIDDKSAISHVLNCEYDKATQCSLLRIQIETGRKHQIRKHLSGAGFPVVGDRLYGSTPTSAEIDLQLKAKSLTFVCPITQKDKYFTLDS